ncbi:GntR family transcriptional regulator [Bradyrhizobium sp. 164]|uniref:GntR family transcriptional regulator n=1 Tax=Bradyrhizobium sp. 164 TaxID=2782637 RepID=UPI001FF8EAF9|nr:GntR family transcriptional regulator [Bradyrhizobium sp. 164]
MGPLQFQLAGSPGNGPRSLTSALHERLRTDILATRLLPGQKLHIAGLAKQFSVSLPPYVKRCRVSSLTVSCRPPTSAAFA